MQVLTVWTNTLSLDKLWVLEVPSRKSAGKSCLKLEGYRVVFHNLVVDQQHRFWLDLVQQKLGQEKWIKSSVLQNKCDILWGCRVGWGLVLISLYENIIKIRHNDPFFDYSLQDAPLIIPSYVGIYQRQSWIVEYLGLRSILLYHCRVDLGGHRDVSACRAKDICATLGCICVNNSVRNVNWHKGLDPFDCCKENLVAIADLNYVESIRT